MLLDQEGTTQQDPGEQGTILGKRSVITDYQEEGGKDKGDHEVGCMGKGPQHMLAECHQSENCSGKQTGRRSEARGRRPAGPHGPARCDEKVVSRLGSFAIDPVSAESAIPSLVEAAEKRIEVELLVPDLGIAFAIPICFADGDTSQILGREGFFDAFAKLRAGWNRHDKLAFRLGGFNEFLPLASSRL